MISIDADILYAAVNAGSPKFAAARELVDGLMESADVILFEPVLIQLYWAIARESEENAVAVIRALRQNPHWRIADIQSSRASMNGIWEAVFAGKENLEAIYRRRLVALLRQNGVDRFYTGSADAYRRLGCEAATDLPEGARKPKKSV